MGRGGAFNGHFLYQLYINIPRRRYFTGTYEYACLLAQNVDFVDPNPLAFSVIMLNTDHFNPRCAPPRLVVVPGCVLSNLRVRPH